VSRLTVTRVQARVEQRLCLLGQQDAVGGERQVAQPALRARLCTSTGRSRRSSGSPPVKRTRSTPQRDEGVDEQGQLLEVQDLLARQPGRTPPPACM
jgi:hypothetical protein